MRFPIGKKVIDFREEHAKREAWYEKLQALNPVGRSYFALACARRIQMLFLLSTRPLPEKFYAELEHGLSLAESLVTKVPTGDAEESAHRLTLLSTHLGLKSYGAIPYGVAVCASAAISTLAEVNNLSSASIAVNVVEGLRIGLPEPVWKHIHESMEKDFDRILSEFAEQPRGAIITPSEFIQAQTTFTNESQIKPLLVAATGGFNAALIERFARDPQQLYGITPRSFEELIAEVFDGFGFEVELTKRTRDNGRDVIAMKHAPTKLRCLIECKRHASDNKVDVGIVRELFGVLHDDGATNGILATTSFFTAPAKDFIQRNQWRLDGKDFHGVLEWLREYQTSQLKQASKK